MLEKPKLRILSISTGSDSAHKGFDKAEFTKFDLLTLLGEFAMEIEIFNTNNLVEAEFAEMKKQQNLAADAINYFRCDGDS